MTKDEWYDNLEVTTQLTLDSIARAKAPNGKYVYINAINGLTYDDNPILTLGDLEVTNQLTIDNTSRVKAPNGKYLTINAMNGMTSLDDPILWLGGSLMTDNDVYFYGSITSTTDFASGKQSGGGALLLSHGWLGSGTQTNPIALSPPLLELTTSGTQIKSGPSLPSANDMTTQAGQIFNNTSDGKLYIWTGSSWIASETNFSGGYDTLFLVKSNCYSPANLDLGTLHVHDDIYSDINKQLGFFGSSGGTLGTNIGMIDFKDTYQSGSRILDFKGYYNASGKYEWDWNYYDGANWNWRAALTQDGLFELPVQGSGGGLQIGGDTNLYRSAADTLRTDDTFVAANINQALTTSSDAIFNSVLAVSTVAGYKLGLANGTTYMALAYDASYGYVAAYGRDIYLATESGKKVYVQRNLEVGGNLMLAGNSTLSNGRLIITTPSSASGGAGFILNEGDTIDGFQINATHTGFSNNLIYGNTTRAANSVFNLLNLKANGVQMLLLDGLGNLTLAGNCMTSLAATGTSTYGFSTSPYYGTPYPDVGMVINSGKGSLSFWADAWGNAPLFGFYESRYGALVAQINSSGNLTLAGGLTCGNTSMGTLACGTITSTGNLYLSNNTSGYLWNNGGYIRQSGGNGFIADGYIVLGSPVSTSTTGPLYMNSSHQIGYNMSSAKYKQNIEDMADCSWIYDLRPVTFDWKDEKRQKEEGRMLGLIAEEVHVLCPQLTWLDDKGQPEGVHYEWLGIPLIVEIQKLKQRIEALENQLKQKQTAA